MMVLRNSGSEILLITFFWLLVSFQQTNAQEKGTYQSLQHALFSSGQLAGDQGPQDVQWSHSGDQYSYTEKDLQHFSPEIRIHDITNEEDYLLFHPAQHTFPGTDVPFHFDDYQWSNDGSSILFQTNFSPAYRYSGTFDYYHYDINSEELTHIVYSAVSAKYSPDGKKVGYHKNGEIFIYDLKTGSEKQLTTSAKDHFYNGRLSWVYEEEFGITEAWKWSRNSRYVAYWQTDERDVETLLSTDYEGVYPEYRTIPYPKPDGNNPKVRIGVLDIETGENHWIDVDGENGLIPRIYWTANPGELAVVWMNREQNHMQLYFYNVDTQDERLVMEEKSDDGWIDIFSSFSGADDYLYFPTDREEFFWMSDRDGFNHIYRYNYDGNLVNRVTTGDWEVTQIVAINPETEKIYFESTEESPLERHLYSIRFNGTAKIQYSDKPGRHEFNMSPNGKYYFDKWSNTQTPHLIELRTTQKGGDLIETIADNSLVKTYLNRYAYQPRELFSFTTEQGVELDGYLIRPNNFDPDKTYPLVLMIYGGPGYQGVFNEFESSTWVQYLAQQGYVIANINNRGSSGYGRDFKESVYKRLGILEAQDYAATATYLAQRSWIDENRIAIRGHSYGGFMSAISAVLYPNIFKLSLVGAPVTDWRLYDSIYTERYMGLPDENDENYNNSSIMYHAHKLRAKMLVTHSSMDDNVHIQNTMQMLSAFAEAGKDVDLRIYPKGKHGVHYNEQSYLLLFQVYTDYLEKHLK
ncbi:S9 family peptidase [Rhodohalobacter barkolensis]|nr:S9 family peptidase [Rhodohalobacter barkolensis]